MRSIRNTLAAICTLAACAAAAEPAFWKDSPTPPLGWNSWDIFGTTVTEAQIKEQATAMARELLPHGYDILTVDIQWYEPAAKGHAYAPNAVLSMDEYGRLTPAAKKFPSAANGKGFRPLADFVHSEGLRFGIHIMRGIPRQAVERNTPVAGTQAHARDIALTQSTCPWNPDMYGVDATLPAGRAYYDSIVRLYASWGVDYIKCDDISRPYDAVQQAEIEALRGAIDKCGRPIILSLSPGATPVAKGPHVMNHANLWRITDDFWDRWGLLHAMFERLDAWTPFRGPGHWPDADMLPLGIVEFGRKTRFTPDEQRTMMTLWAIARSPLIFGGDMTRLDPATKELLTHPGMLAVNQHSSNGRQVSRKGNLIVWTADAPGGRDKYVALFNARGRGGQMDFADAGYSSPVIASAGNSQDVSVSIKGGKRLALFVKDGGDGLSFDHAAWVDPVLRGPKGSLDLTTLEWRSATAGWGEARVNRTCENKPLTVDGKPARGIGTHAESVIIYDIPAGYETFTARSVMTGKGSAVFGVLVDRGEGANDSTAKVAVEFRDIGTNGKAKVYDIWDRKDLGAFTGSFGRDLPPHGSGLYRVSPLQLAK